MYCDIIVEDRKALRATFVYSTLYTTVDNTGYTNATLPISVFGFADLLPQGLAGSLTPPY